MEEQPNEGLGEVLPPEAEAELGKFLLRRKTKYAGSEKLRALRAYALEVWNEHASLLGPERASRFFEDLCKMDMDGRGFLTSGWRATRGGLRRKMHRSLYERNIEREY